jgi:UDP-N-acetylmuramoyl-tripeptide--D-alanyl-D-alanine ligase
MIRPVVASVSVVAVTGSSGKTSLPGVSRSTAARAPVVTWTRRRTVAVLGYLAEVGEQEQAGHDVAGRPAANLNVDRVVVVGDITGGIHDGAMADAAWGGTSVQVTDLATAVSLLRDRPRPGDVAVRRGFGVVAAGEVVGP